MPKIFDTQDTKLAAEFVWRNPKRKLSKFIFKDKLGQQWEALIADGGIKNWKLLHTKNAQCYYDVERDRVIVRKAGRWTGPQIREAKKKAEEMFIMLQPIIL